MSNPFDFSSRDYVSFRNQLVGYLQNKVPGWTADPSDFGLAILEGTAYIGDMMSYYVDRAAQESNILTANQAQNIYALARLFGYSPGLARSAHATVTFSNPTDADVKIGRGTTIGAATGGLSYEVILDVIVPAAEGSESGEATTEVWEGVTRTRSLGISTGFGNQRFLLPEKNIDGRPEAFTVYTQDPTNESILEFWNPSEMMLDSPSGDYVFTPTIYPDGTTYISFGDGIAGRVPPKGWSINVTYRTTSGALGNSPAALTTFLVSWDDPSLVSYSGIAISMTNGEGPSGGVDAEPVDSIRAGTVNLTKTQRRAVTSLDYESLIKADSRILDAACQAKVWSRPIIWIMPKEFGLLTNVEGMNSLIAQTESAALQAAVAGVRPDVRLGSDLAFSVELEVIAAASVDVQYVARQVQEVVYQAFIYGVGVLGAPVSYDHIIRAISNSIPISVVQFARVTGLHIGASVTAVREVNPLINEVAHIPNTDAVVVTVSKMTGSGRTR